jgi:hypothetical protein
LLDGRDRTFQISEHLVLPEAAHPPCSKACAEGQRL